MPKADLISSLIIDAKTENLQLIHFPKISSKIYPSSAVLALERGKYNLMGSGMTEYGDWRCKATRDRVEASLNHNRIQTSRDSLEGKGGIVVTEMIFRIFIFTLLVSRFCIFKPIRATQGCVIFLYMYYKGVADNQNEKPLSSFPFIPSPTSRI